MSAIGLDRRRSCLARDAMTEPSSFPRTGGDPEPVRHIPFLRVPPLRIYSLVSRRIARLFSPLLVASCLAAGGTGDAQAQMLPLVRDAEIEFHLRAWSEPVFDAASLEPDSVEIYLVNSPAINAFVMGGQNIFLNTGLIVRAGSADALVGVIAHETGHIAAGHLVRSREAAEKAAIVGLATTLIAIGASALGGGDDAVSIGAAGISLGNNVATKMFLQHSRTAEHAADAAALQYLATVGRPARPMVQLLSALLAKEQTLENLDRYARTHPLTQERIQQILDWTRAEASRSEQGSSSEEVTYDRLVAKIVAFTDQPDKVLQRYRATNGLAARYARAIAHYRRFDLIEALFWIDGLLADHPDDHYFHELRGQILLENGRVEEAASSYRKAADLAPDSPLILVGFAQAELETEAGTDLDEITAVLEHVLDLEPANARAWRLLAVAHGRSDRDAFALLASAELALLRGRTLEAQRFAERALRDLPKGSPASQRAEDIGLLLQGAGSPSGR